VRAFVTPDYLTLSRTACDVIADALRLKPALCLGLPTGETPLGMYEELVRRYKDGTLDFSQVRTFNLDEYAGLPPHHPGSYHSYMRRHLFDHVNIKPENIHIPNGAAADLQMECELYEKAMQDAGGIDLLVAGIGANGHIAFNEPGATLDSRTRVVDLAPETIANAKRQFGSDPVPQRAITMGVATLLEARRILLIASGASKAHAVERAMRGPVSESAPASALQLHKNVLVILDDAAKF
jgi:glucosamine-6-phosphate deaminase